MNSYAAQLDIISSTIPIKIKIVKTSSGYYQDLSKYVLVPMQKVHNIIGNYLQVTIGHLLKVIGTYWKLQSRHRRHYRISKLLNNPIDLAHLPN